MFKKAALKQCLVLFLALAGAACSSTNTNTRVSNRAVLPAIPMPQTREQPPRNIYVPPVFDEYRPQQTDPYRSQDNYGGQAPEKDYRDNYSYTVPVEPERLAVADVVTRPRSMALQPSSVEPLTATVEKEDFSKNELDIDPFADVPDREVVSVPKKRDASVSTPASPRPVKAMSRAAKALSLAARSESAAGRDDAAINKVERALRIEPQSPELWYQLATLNFKKGRYDQAIGFARKALPMARGQRGLVNQNLNLMSKAAVKSGNTKVFKEVLDYKKQNF